MLQDHRARVARSVTRARIRWGMVALVLVTSGIGLGMSTIGAATAPSYPPFSFAFGTANYESTATYGDPDASLQEQYASYSSWSSMVSSIQANAPTWVSYDSPLVLGVGILPTGTSFPSSGDVSGKTLTSLKSTATSVAQALVSAGLGTAIIRLGWEFNGNWYAWAAEKNPAAYANAFQIWVTQMRAVAGANFKFDWGAAQGQGWNIAAAYPGNSYVDYIGVDPYDQDYSYTPNNLPTDTDTTWGNILGTSGNTAYTYDSLQAIVAFATANGKQVSLPEWGCWFKTDDHGLGDDPTYIENIFNFVTNPSNRVGYFIYFSDDEAGDGDHSLSDGAFPNALAEFETLFDPLITPAVTAVSPPSGSAVGGTSVTVAGTNFSGVTAVNFGLTAATNVKVMNATELTATAPVGSNTADVTVTTLGGTSPTSSADRFTYLNSSGTTISAVGTLANKAGTDTTTLAVSPQHVGDVMVLAVKIGSTSVAATAVTGGGVSAWTQAQAPYAASSGLDVQLWTGTVTASGSSTITVTFASSVTSIYTGLAVQEFSASSGAATVWGTDTGGGISNPSSTMVTFPALTPSGTGELYFAYAAAANTASAGTTSGFHYATTSSADVTAYDTNVSGPVQPTAKQTPAGLSGALAVLLTASTSSGTTAPGSPTITSVVPGNGQLTVNFAPGPTGGSPITSFTVTCGGKSVPASASAVSATVPGLGNGTLYSCTVSATNIDGPGGLSTPVTGTPIAPGTPTITAVGTLDDANATGQTTLPVTAATVGDPFVLGVTVLSPTVTVSSVAGGGVGTWTNLSTGTDGSRDTELWLGTITTPGPQTIAVTYSGPVTSVGVELIAQEYSSGLGPSSLWSKDAASSSDNSTSSATVDYPSLTPTGSNELYVGWARTDNTGVAGSTPGFSYDLTTSGSGIFCFDGDVSATSAPTAAQSAAGTSLAAGALVTATLPAPPPPPPPTISAVGTLANKAGTDTTTLAVSPQHVGDVMVLAVKIHSTSVAASAVAGGGVTTWTQARAPYAAYSGFDVQLWTGTVTASGSSTITVTFASSVKSTYTGLAVQEFSASSGAGTAWGIDTGGGISNPSSTTVTFPALTPSGTGELYFAYAAAANTASAGTTTGFHYPTTSSADVTAYDTNVSGPVQPTAKQTPAGLSGALAVLLTASA
jgi:hypothetical protein